MEKDNTFRCSDGFKLSYNLWMPEEGKKVRFFLQIIHGMAEHSARYEKFAKFLTNEGIAVFACDLRGHGKSTKEADKGFFAEEDGWKRVCDDCFEFANYIVNKYGASELFLLGHSMGSFLARTIMYLHPDFYSGVIIMGTGASQGLLGKIGKLICYNKIKKDGLKAPAYTMNKLSFGSYNKRIEDNKTEFDWLSTDDAEVEKYIKDPNCGFICTNAFFLDLLEGIEIANSFEKASTLPKDLPLLIISGDSDPVGNFGHGVKKVYNLYKSAGITDVELKLIENARHEVLNEKNRKEVYQILLDWLNRHTDIEEDTDVTH